MTTTTLNRSGSTTRAPLVCTLGGSATPFSAYPAPGVCSCVFFTHVLVSNGKLRGSRGAGAWRDFVRTLRDEEFAGYPGGVSFDARYVAPGSLDDDMVKQELGELASNNIKHYGILNAVTSASLIALMVANVGTLTAALRQLQEGDRFRRVVVAAGLSNYDAPAAWTVYQAQFRVLASFDVDILISISSVRTMAQADKQCFAAPPTVWNSTSAAYPGLDKQAVLLQASQPYPRQDQYVGLSFEMGVLLYELQDPSTPLESTPYAPCSQFTLLGYEQVCDPKVTEADGVAYRGVRSNLAIRLLLRQLGDYQAKGRGHVIAMPSVSV